MAKSPNAFRSAAHRRAAFRNEPTLAQNIADKYGAKVGGGFTKAQLSARASKAGKASAQARKP
jgi:hypothetical protein